MYPKLSPVLAFLVLGLFAQACPATTIALVPVGVTNPAHPHTIMGEEIRMPRGGVGVILDIMVSDWGPAQLWGCQADIDPSGYSNGTPGVLSPVVTPDASAGAFIDTGRPDFVFSGLGVIAAVDTSSLHYRFGAGTNPPVCISDPGSPRYLGTLILNVPADASDLYRVNLFPSPSSLAIDCDSSPLPLAVQGARIRIIGGGGGDTPSFFNCRNFPQLCYRIEGLEPELPLDCWHFPCRLLDPLPQNCQRKWKGACPGCEGSLGALCPPYYTMRLSGLGKDWAASIVTARGDPIFFLQKATQDGVLISFRPSHEGFIEGMIGNYFLAFDLRSKAAVGRRSTVRVELVGVGDPFANSIHPQSK